MKAFVISSLLATLPLMSGAICSAEQTELCTVGAESSAQKAAADLLAFELPAQASPGLREYLLTAQDLAFVCLYIAADTPEEQQTLLNLAIEKQKHSLVAAIHLDTYLARLAKGEITPEFQQQKENEIEALVSHYDRAITFAGILVHCNPYLNDTQKQEKINALISRGKDGKDPLNLTNAAINRLFSKYGNIDADEAVSLLKSATRYYVFSTTRAQEIEPGIWEALERYCELKGPAFNVLRMACIEHALSCNNGENFKTNARLWYRLGLLCDAQHPGAWGYDSHNKAFVGYKTATAIGHPDAAMKLLRYAETQEDIDLLKNKAKAAGWDASTDYANEACSRSGNWNRSFNLPYYMSTEEEFLTGCRIAKLLSKCTLMVDENKMSQYSANPWTVTMFKLAVNIRELEALVHTDLWPGKDLSPEQWKRFDDVMKRASLNEADYYNTPARKASIYRKGCGGTRAGKSLINLICTWQEAMDKGDVGAATQWATYSLKQAPNNKEAFNTLYSAYDSWEPSAIDFFSRKDFSAGKYMSFTPNNEAKYYIKQKALAIGSNRVWKEIADTATDEETKLAALLLAVRNNELLASRTDDALQGYAQKHPEMADAIYIIRLIILREALDSSYPTQTHEAYNRLCSLLEEIPTGLISKEAAQDFRMTYAFHNKLNNAQLQRRLHYDAEHSKALSKIQTGKATCLLLEDGDIIAESADTGSNAVTALLEAHEDDTEGNTVITAHLSVEEAETILHFGIQAVYAVQADEAALRLLKEKKVITNK